MNYLFTYQLIHYKLLCCHYTHLKYPLLGACAPLVGTHPILCETQSRMSAL